MPNKGITLGLDLQGGIHLVMEVDEDRAVEIAVDRSVVSLQDVLVDKKIPVESVTRTGPTHDHHPVPKCRTQGADPEVDSMTIRPSAKTSPPDPPIRLVWELREAESQADQGLRDQPGAGNDPEPHRPVRRGRTDGTAAGVEADRRAACPASKSPSGRRISSKKRRCSSSRCSMRTIR